MSETAVYRQRTNRTTLLLSVIPLIIGVGLIYLSGFLENHPRYASLTRELGSVFIAAVCLAGLWEFAAKRSFMVELLAASNLADRIHTTGVVGLSTRWSVDIPWDRLFIQASQIDIFLAYGVTWRGLFTGQLRQFATTHGTRCRIVLPDPDNENLVRAVAAQFGKDYDGMRTRIVSAKEDFVAAFEGIANPAFSYEIWYSQKPPLFSFYIFGEHAVVTLFRHVSAASNGIGFTVERGGDYYQFLSDEFKGFVDGERPLARRVVPTPAVVQS